jgi:hypothetical protein
VAAAQQHGVRPLAALSRCLPLQQQSNLSYLAHITTIRSDIVTKRQSPARPAEPRAASHQSGQPGARRFSPDTRPGLAPRLAVCLQCGSPCSVLGDARAATKNCRKSFREDSPQCRICAREAEQRNPVVRVAAGVVAAPREQWAKDLIARLR